MYDSPTKGQTTKGKSATKGQTTKGQNDKNIFWFESTLLSILYMDLIC